LLIDRTHRTWAWTTAALALASVGLYLYLRARTAGGLTGGDLVGLAYGVAGSLLMLFAGALSLLRKVPSWWWLGARQHWLRGHIWLGLLSGVLILCHSGGRFGGPLETVLMVLVLLVLLTGVAGLVFQYVFPRLITIRIPCEAPYEQIPHLCDAMRQKADDEINKLRQDARIDRGAAEQLAAFYDETVRPFLASRYHRGANLADPLRAEGIFARLRQLPGMSAVEPQLAWLQTCCEERRQLGEQEWLHFWLHFWLLVHVPLSAALLVLGLTHAVMALYY
jgi:hypothetical protein